ncbi:GPW/gp25 family protein [Zymomonas mobilis]|uniref:GPW/gp25 family protein n=1 Tax=Zymomonas mobilis TaxID=542 RepID=UPI0039E8B2FA
MAVSFNRLTGAVITGMAHIIQSVDDILTTPIGTRICRRDYGSLIPYLIDQPFNATTAIRVYAATAQALSNWEPRLSIQSVNMIRDDTGAVSLSIRSTVKSAGNSLSSFTIPLNQKAGQ